MPSRKIIGAAAMTAALAAGGLVGASLGNPGVSGAQDDTTTTTTAPADQGTDAGADHEGRGGRGVDLSAAATALGITEDELRTALQDGKSLADVAADQGVDKQKVIDALVAAAKERLAAAVTAGDLTQAEADERSADLEARITEEVDEVHEGGRGGGGHGG
jgi:hypothetical protein